MNKLILVGFFEESLELINNSNYKIEGVVDFNDICEKKHSITFLGNDDQFLTKERIMNCKIIVTPDQPQIRKRLINRYKEKGYEAETIIDNSCTVSSSSIIGDGCLIYKRANISSNVKIGNYVRINTLANIMHNCDIGDYSTIAPNAVLLGNVKVGTGAYIGANATVLPYVKIGRNTIIGAGAVVTKDVPDNYIVVGNPAKLLRKNI